MSSAGSVAASCVADRLTELIAAGREQRLFSAAAWAIGERDRVLTRGQLGTRAWPEIAAITDSQPLDTSPLDGTELFDLASVTKPLVAIVIFALIEEGRLDLSDTVGELLPEYAAAPVSGRPVAELLLHTSGLPGGVPLFRRAPTRAALLAEVARLPLLTPPGTRVDYSSQGFILLGQIAERTSGLPLQTLITDLVAAPARAGTLQFVPRDISCVATEFCRWRGHVVQGEVHDENTVVLGGIAGHAGLFGSLDDMINIAGSLVVNQSERIFLAPTTHQMMITPRTDRLNLRRSYGWQGIDHPRSVAGSLIGPGAYGHTGFTGTSIFIDPDRSRWYVLLANRVHPSRDGDGFATVRQRFHNVASQL
jgi:CubicO group peptidase (beta-lactamase class C family)